MKKRDALNILGLNDGATDDEVKQAHRQKVRENHPDRFTDSAEKSAAEEKTKLINEARDVLLSRRWDPEYGPRAGQAGTYAYPYSGNPFAGAWPGGATAYTYTTRTGGSQQGQQGDPFYGIPFTFVWTSWDNIGTDGTARSGSAGGTGAYDPFDTFDPFDAFSTIFTQIPRKTARQQYEEAKQSLRSFSIIVAVKAAILALCAAFGGLAAGMFIYMITTVLYAIAREVRGCSSFLVIPFVVLFGLPIIWMVPSFESSIGLGLMVFFGIAVAYDIGTLRRLIETMRTYKQKASIEQ